MLSAELSDYVIVLDKGVIVQSGTPNSLSNIDGYYQNLLLAEGSSILQ
jgi:ABC-type multidrug transport system fused ATPase/permease subunit